MMVRAFELEGVWRAAKRSSGTGAGELLAAEEAAVVVLNNSGGGGGGVGHRIRSKMLPYPPAEFRAGARRHDAGGGGPLRWRRRPQLPPSSNGGFG